MSLSRTAWRKSSHSRPDGDDCVEVARLAEACGVRDSKDPGGPVLTFTMGEWACFLGAIKAVGHDLP
ncbi:DUF397 domain-containing protein [Actinomadura sp. 6N118]|uniref:DUF397 domain-containing protein n=1 Tax=Actinomadura sp. 6N118 TaxID=3375151 RepID=UPI00378DC158